MRTYDEIASDLVYHAGQIATHQERLESVRKEMRVMPAPVLVPVYADTRTKGLLRIPRLAMVEKKIATIKIVRDVTGLGLKDSVDAVDLSISSGNPIPMAYAYALWAVQEANGGVFLGYGVWRAEKVAPPPFAR